MNEPARSPLWIAAIAAALVASVGAPDEASAQAPQAVPDEANRLYQEGAAAMIKKDYVVACSRFEQVSRMVPDGGGVRLNLAECHEEQGKLASAYAQYGIAETLAKKDGRKDRLKTATAGAARVKPKLAMLVVTVPEGVRSLPDVVIKLDGEVLGEKVWGVPYPVDRGAHTLVATARGYAPGTVRVDVPKDGVTTTTGVPPLAPAPAAAPESTPSPVVSPADPVEPKVVFVKEEGVFTPQVRTAAVIGGGALALGGIAAGGVMLGLSFAKNDELQKARLDPFGQETAKTAAQAKADTLSTAIWCFVGGGAAAIGTGAFYFVTRPRVPPPVKAGAFVGPGGPGVWIQGQF